jgi:hypothetical protein
MRTELYRRDDGWIRRIVYHDDGRIEYPDGVPILVGTPRTLAEVKHALEAHGYELVEWEEEA